MTSASVASRRLLYPTLTAPIASIVTGIFLHRHPDKCHVGQRLGAISLTAGALIMFALTFSNNESKGEWYFIARLICVHAGMGVMSISSLIDILSISGTGELEEFIHVSLALRTVHLINLQTMQFPHHLSSSYDP